MEQKLKSIISKILIKSQKFTGTDIVYIATQGSYLTIGNIISFAASFLLAMVFARLLPKETYGEYRYILSIMTMIGIFALPGMDDALLQAVAKRFEGCFKKAFKEKIRWGILGSLTCLIIAGYFFFKNNLDLTVSFVIAGVFFPLMEATGIYLSYLGGKKLFGIQTKYTVLTQIISAFAIIITLIFTKNLIGLVLIYFFSNTFLRSIFLLYNLKRLPPNKKEKEKFINFGKHLSFLRIVHTIAAQIDRLLLFHFLGAVQVAIYSFATLPVSEANIFLKNIRLLALPKLATRSMEEIKKNLLKKVAKATILIAPLVLLYIIIAPYFYKIFFPQYTESVFFSQLLFLTILTFPASLIALSFQAQMAKKELYQFSIISPLISIILLVILTPIYGIIGAIIAQLIAHLFTVCFSMFLFRKI
ncbi:MAG: oligosaccharide flippase family protein [Patescibacteria group bacterium]